MRRSRMLTERERRAIQWSLVVYTVLVIASLWSLNPDRAPKQLPVPAADHVKNR